MQFKPGFQHQQSSRSTAWLPLDSGHVDLCCCEVPEVVDEEKAEVAVAVLFTRASHHLTGRKKTFHNSRISSRTGLVTPLGQVDLRGTTGQGRGESRSRRHSPAPGVGQHAFDLVKYSIFVTWSHPSRRRYTSMDRTLEIRWRKF
ncbi:hypothetical protein MRX96_011895 [Rhipicephalus microplus]